MKKMMTMMLLTIAATPAFAGQIKANCENSTNIGLIDDKEMSVTIEDTKVDAKSANYEFTGKFVKVVRNGSKMYNSPDVTDLADQTDYGYIFVSSSLAAGNDGDITFSTRQLGDSEGSAWLNETYRCKVSQ